MPVSELKFTQQTLTKLQFINCLYRNKFSNKKLNRALARQGPGSDFVGFHKRGLLAFSQPFSPGICV